MANNPEIMGQNIAAEITAAESVLAGTESLEEVRLLMMTALARGVVSEVGVGGPGGVIDGGRFGPDATPSWDFGSITSPISIPGTDFGTINAPTGVDADFGEIE